MASEVTQAIKKLNIRHLLCITLPFWKAVQTNYPNFQSNAFWEQTSKMNQVNQKQVDVQFGKYF